MADPAFPDNVTTKTTVTTTNTSVQTNIRYDPTYVRSPTGMIKIAQIVLNLLVFIFVSFSQYANTGRMSFMSGICGLGFWFTAILMAFYVFHIIEKFFRVPWLKIELIYCAIWTFFLMVGSTMCTAYIGAAAIFGVVAFFGFIDMCVYGYDAFLKFQGVQNGDIAQGTREINRTSASQVESPTAY